MATNPFKEETQQLDFVWRINKKLERAGAKPALFWESKEDRFVSREALLQGADVIELVMTREQFLDILNAD